jgi:hypothetical protein
MINNLDEAVARNFWYELRTVAEDNGDLLALPDFSREVPPSQGFVTLSRIRTDNQQEFSKKI